MRMHNEGAVARGTNISPSNATLGISVSTSGHVNWAPHPPVALLSCTAIDMGLPRRLEWPQCPMSSYDSGWIGNILDIDEPPTPAYRVVSLLKTITFFECIVYWVHAEVMSRLVRKKTRFDDMYLNIVQA